MKLTLNADLGEGGPADAELMALVSAVNVGCGMHAGDPPTTRAALAHAARLDLAIGAHPGYPDREHFGRRELNWPADIIYAHVHYQLGGLLALASVSGATVSYLKPHGALYHRCAADHEVAKAVAAVAWQHALALVGLPDSELEAAAATLRVPFRREGFADRRYDAAGKLVPRDRPDALLHDSAEAVEQVLRLAETLQIETVCVHGDTPGALAFTQAVRDGLESAGAL